MVWCLVCLGDLGRYRAKRGRYRAKPQVALRGQQCLQLQKVRLLLPEEDPDEGGGAGGRPGAGLQFPVGRIHRLLRSASRDLFPNSLLGRKGNYTGAPVYMAVVME